MATSNKLRAMRRAGGLCRSCDQPATHGILCATHREMHRADAARHRNAHAEPTSTALTLREVAAEIGVCYERVRQLEASGLRKVRAALTVATGEEVDEEQAIALIRFALAMEAA